MTEGLSKEQIVSMEAAFSPDDDQGPRFAILICALCGKWKAVEYGALTSECCGELPKYRVTRRQDAFQRETT